MVEAAITSFIGHTEYRFFVCNEISGSSFSSKKLFHFLSAFNELFNVENKGDQIWQP